MGGGRSAHETDSHRGGKVSGNKQQVPWWIPRGEGGGPRRVAGRSDSLLVRYP